LAAARQTFSYVSQVWHLETSSFLQISSGIGLLYKQQRWY